MEFQEHTLKNGIRLIHIAENALVSHLGLLVNTGSRDEREEEQGMAHFIEHVLFKGTKKRKAFHIISRMEDVGADMNAYTAKEETSIYASFLSEYYDRALELFADISFNSIFPAKELEKEKEVILDEINSYLDSPSEQIFDDFEELVFKNHPLGRNILGTPESVRSFTQRDVRHFMKRNYRTDELILCSIGNIRFDKLVYLAEKYFSTARSLPFEKNRHQFNGGKPEVKKVKKETYQTHCIVGATAYALNDPRRIPLFLLNNILAGPGLNSRLNLALREKHGYAYNIESNYTPYSDTGLMTIYFGTDNGYLNKSLRIITSEIKKLQTKALGNLQLSKAKKQLIGQMAIGNENRINQLLSVGKSYLVYNRCDSIEEINRKIEQINKNDLLEVANEILSPKRLSTLIYQ